MNRNAVRAMFGLGMVVSVFGAAGPVQAETRTPALVAGDYHADVRFPEYMPLWREAWDWKDESGKRVRYAHEGMPLGGYLFAYIRNTTDRTFEVEDVLLEGVSLDRAIAREPKGDAKYASNLHFSELPADQIATLKRLGEPVWWQVDPAVIEPGQMAQAVVRLRRDLEEAQVAVGVVGSGVKLQGVVNVDGPTARVMGISFSPGLDRMFVYLKHPKGGIGPEKIMVDGRDVTAQCTIAADRDVEVVPVVIQLSQRLEKASFHVVRAMYGDGASAISAIRVWRPEFLYGMWGFMKKEGSPKEAVPPYLRRLYLHNINLIAGHFSGWVRKYVRTPEGQSLCKKLGIEMIDHYPQGFGNQRYNFLMDEPDAGDFRSRTIPSPRKRLGSLAQFLVEKGRKWRKEDPHTLQILNVDNTFKPEQWYMYAQLPDIACTDPYYLGQLRSVYRWDPEFLDRYRKPTYVYAAGRIYGSACAPKPMHVILQATRFDIEAYPFRGPTPLEKRVEVYYALAAGAKQISYWWYTPTSRYSGCGGDTPEMRSLMREIGLLGAEARTAEPVLTRACPVGIPVEGTRELWGRSLLAGNDTMVAVLVNDTISCDREGSRVTPLKDARFRVELPSWLEVSDCFAVTCRGVGEVSWQVDGAHLEAKLGTLDATRLVVMTSDSALRARLDKRYKAQFAGNVKKLLSGEQAGQ